MQGVLLDLTSDQVLKLVSEGKRVDGRPLDKYREISIEKDISKNANGSAKVKLGKTEVVVGIKMILGEPYPDSPDEGSICVGAELLSLASPEFETGPPSAAAIELARVVDRCVRESKTIDFKELCVKEGELVWIVFIDLYVLNADGNLFDAAAIASLSALSQAKYPKLEDGKIVKGEFGKPLSLKRKALLSTFTKIGNNILVDATHAEEKAMNARFSVATTDDGYICAFQKGFGGSFSMDEISQCIDKAFDLSKELRKQI